MLGFAHMEKAYMRLRILILSSLLISGLFATPVYAKEETTDEKETHEPLRVLITPMSKDRFDGTFQSGAAVSAPRLNHRYTCPFYDELVCDVTAGFSSLQDKWRIDNVVRSVVANLVHQIQREHYNNPNLGLVMGKKYYGLPDYVIMASLGINPGLWEEGGLNDGIYGSLYHADHFSLADRIGGPIILAQGVPQIERLWDEDNILDF